MHKAPCQTVFVAVSSSFIHSFIYTCARQAQQAQLGKYRSNQLSPTSSVMVIIIDDSSVVLLHVTCLKVFDVAELHLPSL